MKSLVMIKILNIMVKFYYNIQYFNHKLKFYHNVQYFNHN